MSMQQCQLTASIVSPWWVFSFDLFFYLIIDCIQRLIKGLWFLCSCKTGNQNTASLAGIHNHSNSWNLDTQHMKQRWERQQSFFYICNIVCGNAFCKSAAVRQPYSAVIKSCINAHICRRLINLHKSSLHKKSYSTCRRITPVALECIVTFTQRWTSGYDIAYAAFRHIWDFKTQYIFKTNFWVLCNFLK